MKFRIALVAVAIALAACTDREAARRAAAEALARQQEEAAGELARQYDQELVAQRWEKARIHGAALLAQYPDTKAAAEVKQTFDDTKARAEAQREQDRLSSLWNYAEVSTAGGTQRSASIYSKEGVDVDGSGPRTVQLVFRDHPKWKRSSYLVLQTGDFRCPGGCTVKISADGASPKSMAATRPNTDEAIAMFINDNKAFWKLAAGSKKIEIEFPVKAGGTRKAVFETGGVNKDRLPGW